MNIEELQGFCLTLGEVEEKMPFGKFKHGDSYEIVKTEYTKKSKNHELPHR